jgi:S-disulfanyl-L-cysteine oxidoreductase SoxD
LTGDDFLTRWQGRTAAELFAKTRTTMPPTNPGGLSNETYMDIVAYILRANDFPAPKEMLKEDTLKDLSMTKK